MKRTLLIRMVAPAIALMALGVAGAFGKTQEQVDVSVTLTTDQQAVMQQAHGADWSTWLHEQLREATRNHLNTARETVIRNTAARLRSAEVTPDEAITVLRILDNARAREERKQIIPEEPAPEVPPERLRESGSLRIENDGFRSQITDEMLIGMNIGKALSPRLAFLDGLAGDLPDPSLPRPHAPFYGGESGLLTYVVVVHVLAIVGAIALGCWAYTTTAE